MSNTWYDMSMTWTFMNIPAAQVAPWPRRVTEAILRGTSQSEKVPYPATELPGRSGRAVYQSCCGPFQELEKWSNCVELGEIQKLLQKKLDVLFFFDFLSFLFSILVGFFVFESNLTKSKICQKKLIFFIVFFRFVLVFFSFFSDLFSCVFSFFSILFRIISNQRNMFNLCSNYFWNTKTMFNSCSNYFRIKNNFGIMFEPEAHFDFVFAITGAIATVIFATLAGFVATS